MPRRTPRVTAVPASSRALEHLRRIIQAIHSQSAVIEAATGLTGPQFWALREIARAEDGISLGDLAQRLALHKANAGRLAERLARKRLISRETPADDRRMVIVRATVTGRRKSALHVATPPQAVLLARLDELPAAELDAIEGALGRLVELLGVEGEEAAPMFDRAPRGRRVGQAHEK
jgi:DNA-binding MarR family transcriptional regulator